MDVETERLERADFSPKSNLDVDSCVEDSVASASYPASNNVVVGTLSENFQEEKIAKNVESSSTNSESDVKVSEMTPESDEVPINEKCFQETVTFSEKDTKNSADMSDRLELMDELSSDISVKLHSPNIVSEKETLSVADLTFATDNSALNNTNSIGGQDGWVLSDKSTDSINGFSCDVHENGLQKETYHSENQLDLELNGILAHGVDQASESKSSVLEKLNGVKKPEELDHEEAAKISQDDENLKEASGQTQITEKTDHWLYVFGHDRLKKRVIKKGLENTHPLRGQIVNLNCVGRLEDGTQVDKHENLSITLGDGDFIQAFDLCVALMDREETCEVVTESPFAYGELGRAPDIPPNACISYTIELVDCHNAPALSTLSITDRIKLSDEKRERGNYLYSRNEFSRSIDSYTKALKALDEDFESRGDSAEELQQLIDSRVKCHNNMAAAQMKVNAWDSAVKSCDVVLKVQPDNVKALFRKGKCFANKGDVSTAISLLKRALKLEPETKIIHQELSRLDKKSRVQAETEKALYQKMLGTGKDPAGGKKKKENEETSSKWFWYVSGGLAAVLASVGLVAYRYLHY